MVPSSGRKRRTSCIGCLGQLLAVLVLVVLVYLGAEAVVAPWSYYLGGQFHVIPGWWAWGRLHTPGEGDYLLFVNMSPASRGGRVAPIDGWAYLCSPRGEITKLRLYGYMPRLPFMTTDVDGVQISLAMNYRPWYWDFTSERRPRIDFRGQWRTPNLELDDGGSISRAFTPDGVAYLGPAKGQPRTRWTAHLTLRSGSYSEFAAACRSNVRR